MRLTLLIATAIALLAGFPLRADQSFRDFLAALPESALTGPTSALVEYLNMQAMFRDASPFRNPTMDMSLGQTMRPVIALAVGGETNFRTNTDIDPRELGYFASFGWPTDNIVLWGFPDEQAATAAFTNLPGHGFSDVTSSPGLLANGEPDHIDIRRRDPFHPFIGPLGLTSVFAQKQSALLHGSNPKAVTAALDGSTPALDMPSIQTLLAGLETENATVRQAIILSNDPPEPVGGKTFSLILSAELRNPDGQRTILISMAHADCTEAETNLAAMSMIISPSGSRILPTPAGCAAVMTFGPFVAGDNSAQTTFDGLIGGTLTP
ncbi:hypothetical protein JJJ17_03890 [Paracoccus caeni]|uniref:Uncharacterized protein n=1 Tax=Paracoccus caeni TaxID=657651 RepID=A0A934SGN7_9RHOB|nr:hypothetical protein [Paracoccus caeni]MBK4215062.1 hypothetical protein [Paracoccus caeni]